RSRAPDARASRGPGAGRGSDRRRPPDGADRRSRPVRSARRWACESRRTACARTSRASTATRCSSVLVLRPALEPDRARHGLEVKLRVAEVEARRLDAFVEKVERVLLAVADGPEDLMASSRDRQAGFTRIRLGQRRVRLGGPAFRILPGRRVEERARRVDVANEIGARVLDGLIAADGAPALDARLRV